MPTTEQIERVLTDRSGSSDLPEGDPLNFGSGVRGWIRVGTSFLAVLTTILILLQVFYVGSTEGDPDIWWHMRNAAYLLQHHSLPNRDTYSFTVAGQPWINHEWLAELPYYFAFRALGLVGLKSLAIGILATMMLCLLYLCYQESRNFKASVVCCAIATLLATVSYGPRTILFGYLYLVILLIILQRFRSKGSAPVWLIPPLFCLWVNTHGSWSLGLIVFFLVAASGMVGNIWGRLESTRWTTLQLKKLILTGVASVAALFVNPYGWRLVYYPFDLAFKQKLNIAHVAEWVTLDFHSFRGKMVMALVFWLLLSALVRDRRWTLGPLLVLLFGLYSGMTYIRFLFLIGLVLAPVLAQTLDFFPRYRPTEDTPRLNAVVILLLLGAMAYIWPRESTLKKSVDEAYPTGALTYIKANPLQGNMLNFYLWGGYLGWNDPSIKVFVDSRVDIFEYAGVLQDYLDILGIRSPDTVIQKYKIRYVLFPPNEPYSYILQRDPHWKVLYQDKVSILFTNQFDARNQPDAFQ